MGEVVQVDDRSPLIRYNPSAAWIHSREALALDKDFELYGGKTFSQTWNANFTFSFHGTGVQIHGVNNTAPLFGPYSVILASDDGPSTTTSYTGFQSPLYSNITLPPGRYTVTLVVDGPYHVNVDHVGSVLIPRNDQD
ncbi:hypothetical protein BDV98DRAFT_592483 [Pterulicium gracile]|uniref:Rhamnogalacturonan lyase domain-containing protein n=1 Tax=Pterulicium gracile TaxID=1884261 RepID=A0A5C3QN93_9AGAR|nr:hypothetical protein BDV98DRAFT_592483 [Pterula gracilis]